MEFFKSQFHFYLIIFTFTRRAELVFATRIFSTSIWTHVTRVRLVHGFSIPQIPTLKIACVKSYLLEGMDKYRQTKAKESSLPYYLPIPKRGEQMDPQGKYRQRETQTATCHVGWGCRIHRQTPPLNECPDYFSKFCFEDTLQSVSWLCASIFQHAKYLVFRSEGLGSNWKQNKNKTLNIKYWSVSISVKICGYFQNYRPEKLCKFLGHPICVL